MLMVKFIENRVLRMSQDDWGSGQPTFVNKKKNSNGKWKMGNGNQSAIYERIYSRT